MVRDVRQAARLAAAVLALGAARGATAGDWHSVETLICSDCHTIHNSAGGQPMRYDGLDAPAPLLLRAEDSTHLCLACHDGSRPDAPDVVAPATFPLDPAGGWFVENPVGAPNPSGHDLLSPSPLTAPGSTDSLVLGCISCHSPHGGGGYRNLSDSPPGSGNASPVTVVVDPATGGAPATSRIASLARTPLTPGLATAAGVPYESGNQLYRSGISAWCNDCHGNFHGRTGGEEGGTEPWLRHPQDAPLQGAYGVDFTHWSSNIANRVPVESPTDDTIPSADDRVFCLSCHRAHGSNRRAALIWADGATRLSTCQQCHNR